jgi:hypothetical protein
MSVKLGRSHKREEFRLRVFESRILRGITRRERDDVIGNLRKLQDDVELNDL